MVLRTNWDQVTLYLQLGTELGRNVNLHASVKNVYWNTVLAAIGASDIEVARLLRSGW